MSNPASQSKAWHITLWVLQSLLALAFGMAGAMKFTLPPEEVAKQLNFVAPDTAMLLIRIVGVSEVAGALGMILPAALRIQPRLTVFAAVGFVIIMLCAAVISAQQGMVMAIAPLIFCGMAATVAWGRSMKAVIEAK